MDRWAIYIDIEGTTTIFAGNEMRFFQAFDALLKALADIGTKVYPETPHRLFAHQLGGDGLLIVSEFTEGSPEIPVSIASVLLQVLLMHGSVGKAGISVGKLADVKGCFPSLAEVVQSSPNVYDIGRGVLTIFPVMGTALINAHRLVSRAPSGCLLSVDRALFKALPLEIVLTREETDYAIVDWVHTRTQVMKDILSKSGIELPAPYELEKKLIDYVRNIPQMGEEGWRCNSLLLNGCHQDT